MKIELWTVGKTRTGWIRQGERDYIDRCKRFGAIETLIIPAEKSGNPQYIKSQESARILERLSKSQPIPTILLDERGNHFGSPELAEHIRTITDRQGNRLRFIIGGAYGVDESVRAEAGLVALSQMTFPHELVRVIFLEQLYRAFTILRGESYHHS